MRTDVLRQYTIYCRPSDFPHWYVLRGWSIRPHLLPMPDDNVRLSTTLEGARLGLPQGLVCLGRQPDDDPTIVETWM